jgi:hypothetical protein
MTGCLSLDGPLKFDIRLFLLKVFVEKFNDRFFTPRSYLKGIDTNFLNFSWKTTFLALEKYQNIGTLYLFLKKYSFFKVKNIHGRP